MNQNRYSGEARPARNIPTREQLQAAARREAQQQAHDEAEAEEQEADQSYEGHFAGTHPEHRPYLSGALPSVSTGRRTRSTHAHATHAPITVDAEGDYELEEDESYYSTRLPTSARRYQVSPEHVYQKGNRRYHVSYVDVPPRQSRQAQLPPPRQRDRDEQATAARSTRRIHPLLYLGVGMLAVCALFLVLSSAVTWVQQKRDDLVYGRPRTFQVDAVVGHHDSVANPSHFIALNLNRHIEVIEIPGQDVTAMKVYAITTLFGDGGDVTPVTLSFRDVTGDSKPDLLIHLQETVLVMVNDNGTFRPAKPGEVNGLL